MRRSIRAKFIAVNLLLILFALELIGAYFVRTLNNTLIHNQTVSTENQAELMATIAAPLIGGQNANANVSSILNSLPNLTQGVVYLLNPEGVVLDTSVGSALVGQKRIDSAATQAIVRKLPSAFIRFDPLHQQHVLTVAVPIFSKKNFVGVIEDVVPIEDTYRLLRQVSAIFYTGSLAVLVLTAIIGTILSRTMSKPILDVIQQTKVMAAGDFSQRVPVNTDDEFGDLAMSVNDLTSRLEEAVQEGARERERLRAVMTYMGDGVIAFNEALEPTFYNDAFVKLLPDSKTTGGTDPVSSDVAKTLGIDEVTTPHHMMTLGGETFTRQVGDSILHIHVTPIRKRGGIEGYVALIRDVTDEEKLTRARREFVANVSHELRTPLTTIKSYIEALQDGQDEAIVKKFLGVIENETDRMVRLTRALLQLSGLETLDAKQLDESILVSNLLQGAATRFRMQAESRGIRFSVADDVIDVNARVNGDKDMLDRVLDNIIGNAVHYTGEGGSITIRPEIVGQSVRISVVDTGIGIPKEDLPHVHERFYRVDKARSRRRGGSGLGLALAKEIIDMHNGNLTIDSSLGQGTSVTITLPLSKGGGLL